VASIILVGCGSSREAVSSGDGACLARTQRFSLALEKAGYLADTFEATGSRSDTDRLRRLLRARPGLDAMVALSPFPAETAVMSGVELPLWIDMNGMHPAEVQLAGGDYARHRIHLARMLSLEATLLMRGDRFSTPSRRQRLAVLAELLLLGRLDAASLAVEPVSAIPNCVLPSTAIVTGREGSSDTPGFTIISTGSFNTWFDHRILFRAIETAMEADPAIRFVAAGGPIPHSPGSWEEFGELVSRSRHRERFSMRGWLVPADLERLYADADVAVYADMHCPETELGARTRVLDWIARGIPVVCTRGSEISVDVADEGMGLVVPQGDPEALSAAILSLRADPGMAGAIRERQEVWGRGKGAMSEVFKPLLEWAACPQKLPTRVLGRAPVPSVRSFAYSRLLAWEINRSKGALQTFRKGILRLRSKRSRG
jgi:glycosyltransferase involved in cell wall biosynthesis